MHAFLFISSNVNIWTDNLMKIVRIIIAHLNFPIKFFFMEEIDFARNIGCHRQIQLKNYTLFLFIPHLYRILHIEKKEVVIQ